MDENKGKQVSDNNSGSDWNFENLDPKLIQKVIKEEEKANKEINKLIREDRQRQRKEIVLLLLGTGESGKSTVAKQLRILHQQDWTIQERMEYKTLIYSNVISSLKVIIEAARKFKYTFTPENEQIASTILTYSDSKEITPQNVVDMKKLISDRNFQKTLQRSNEYQLIDSAPYFFDSSTLDRISSLNYIPTNQDILHSRARTTGIVETHFSVEGLNFRLVDVGGQRNERKKWIHCFEGVTAMIFCVALNAYDMKLREDENVNRMHEALDLFEKIVNLHWFQNTDIILFLNKADLFKEKIQKVDLKVCFPEYNGSNDFDQAVEYIKRQFVSKVKNTKKAIYSHITTATDTENIKVVFNAVQECILRDSLNKSGFL
jgi:GTPase SAR1 family protein